MQNHLYRIYNQQISVHQRQRENKRKMKKSYIALQCALPKHLPNSVHSHDALVVAMIIIVYTTNIWMESILCVIRHIHIQHQMDNCSRQRASMPYHALQNTHSTSCLQSYYAFHAVDSLPSPFAYSASASYRSG